MKRGGGVSGAVSLVMIFCVLCLAVFSVLTLATADRESKLSAMTARNAADYYEADRLAVSVVAALRDRSALPADVEIAHHIYAFYPDGSVEDAEFSIPIGDNQALDVAVRLRDQAGKTCDILRWQTVYTGSWEPVDTLPVWDGT